MAKATLCFLLLASAARTQTLESAFLSAARLRGSGAHGESSTRPPVPTSRRILRAPAAREKVSPDSFDKNDGHRRSLLKTGDYWSVPTEGGGILMVVEKNYLDAERLDRVAADLQEAVSAVPRLTGRARRIAGRFTVYIYDQGPISEAGVPGARRGEKGLMLRHVKKGTDPLFHEVTHLLAGYSGSQSLGEGIADWVQAERRPGRPSAFVPAHANPHALAKAALARWPASFRAAIGAPGDFFAESRGEIRFDFYFCSWSFTNFLLRQGGMTAFWSVADADGKPRSYLKAYGRSRARLIEEWVAEVNRG